MILKETIDKVFALDIVDVIKDYVKLKKTGANYKGLSCFTDERTPSFTVSPAKGIFKCFSSGKGGNLVKFIMEKELMNYPEALKFLCKRFNIECLESEETNEEKILSQKKESMHIINTAALNFYKQNLNYFQEVLNYVYGERQISAEMVNKFEIGFAPSTISGLTNHLINAGYNWQLAVENSVLGYIPEKNNLYDRFRNRVMFPIKNISGNVIGFGGRSLAPNEKNAKYLNSSDSILYNKSEALFGIFESKKAIIDKNQCLLSEGYLDVVMFHQKGVENIVASSGTALTIEHVKLIKRFTKNVVVVFDNDKAGIRATLKGIDILLAEEMYVKVLILPQGQDPDDFAKARNKEEIEKYILDYSQDFVLFKLNHLLMEANGDLNLASKAVEDVLESIAKMPDVVRREVYLKECAAISKISIDMLRITLRKHIADEIAFSPSVPQNFYEQFMSNRNYIQTQCEKKILQYVLAYGSLELTFKEVLLDKAGTATHQYFKERPFDARRTVLDKVKYELETDGIHFLNITYSHIYERAKLADLRNFNSLEHHLDTETYLLAIELRNEELTGNRNTFSYGASIGVQEQNIIPNLHEYLQASIKENLLFYKVMYIEWLIEEESKKNIPNKENVKDYIELIIRIKKELNTI
jgi:DNA primase